MNEVRSVRLRGTYVKSRIAAYCKRQDIPMKTFYKQLGRVSEQHVLRVLDDNKKQRCSLRLLRQLSDTLQIPAKDMIYPSDYHILKKADLRSEAQAHVKLDYDTLSDFNSKAVKEIPIAKNGDVSIEVKDAWSFDTKSDVREQFFRTLDNVITKLDGREWELTLSVKGKHGRLFNVYVDDEYVADTVKQNKVFERINAFIVDADATLIRYNFSNVSREKMMHVLNGEIKLRFDYNCQQIESREANREQEDSERRSRRSQRKPFKLSALAIRSEKYSE